MKYYAEARIDLKTLALSVSTLKSTSNIELLADAYLVILKEILKEPNKPRIQYRVDVDMISGGFFLEWRELLKAVFSKVKVVVIYYYLACTEGFKKK